MLKKFCFSILLYLGLAAGVNASMLDSFRSPSELLQNQKRCWFFNQVQGEMIEGKFLFANIRVLAEFKKLGRDKVSFRRLGSFEEGEVSPVLALSVVKDKSNLFALLPNGTIVLSCSL